MRFTRLEKRCCHLWSVAACRQKATQAAQTVNSCRIQVFCGKKRPQLACCRLLLQVRAAAVIGQAIRRTSKQTQDAKARGWLESLMSCLKQLGRYYND